MAVLTACHAEARRVSRSIGPMRWDPFRRWEGKCEVFGTGSCSASKSNLVVAEQVCLLIVVDEAELGAEDVKRLLSVGDKGCC